MIASRAFTTMDQSLFARWSGDFNPLHMDPLAARRTQAGAPAIHGKLRCRMHGGRNTGPCTARGPALLRAARTVHGRPGAERRGFNRRILSIARSGRVYRAALH